MIIDKKAVREDYVNGYSVRMLASKYGVPKSTVNDWIKKYGWTQERTIDQKKVRALLEAANQETDTPKKKPDTKNRTPSEPLTMDGDFERLRVYTIKLLGKADQLLDLDDALAPRDLKSLSSMLMDVRTLLNILSPREETEQELRLAALRKQGETVEQKEQAVVVRFVDTEGAEV